MLRPFLTSVIVHISIVLLFTISWSFFEDDRLVAQPLVIVDVVATVPKTNLAPSSKTQADKVQKASASRSAPKPPPAPPSRPKPPAAKAAPKPAEKPATKPDIADNAEILPDKNSAVDVPLPKPKVAPVEKVDIALPVRRPEAPKKPAVPTEQPKPKPKPKSKPATPTSRPSDDPDAAERLQDRVNKLAKQQKQKDKTQALTGVLQNLAKASASSKDDAKKQRQSEAQDNVEATLASALEQAVQTNEPTRPVPIGMSEIDRLRAHITQFWSPPVGAADADKLRVTVRIIRPKRDGTVDTVEIENRARYVADKVYRVAADAARRAVLEASPLPLPADKYDQWKDYIIFEFDPSFISGE